MSKFVFPATAKVAFKTGDHVVVVDGNARVVAFDGLAFCDIASCDIAIAAAILLRRTLVKTVEICRACEIGVGETALVFDEGNGVWTPFVRM